MGERSRDLRGQGNKLTLFCFKVLSKVTLATCCHYEKVDWGESEVKRVVLLLPLLNITLECHIAYDQNQM